jgi:solute carrier family 15 (peptide/histidine transporter), member 3/4
VFERMAYYGIASNLVIYLTNKLHQGTVEASNNVSNWAGSVWMMPLVGAYIADAYFGRYWTFVIASCIYLLVCNDIYFHHLSICYLVAGKIMGCIL